MRVRVLSEAEVRTDLEARFPNLSSSTWRPKSQQSRLYRCISWAAYRTNRIWWPVQCPRDLWPPEAYWPESMPLDESITGFTNCFRLLGYEPCTNANFEFGYQKVAIYAYSNRIVAHMARQHFWGQGWLSKLGNLEDIVHHDLFAIEGSTDPAQEEYGQVAQILKRSWFVAAKRDLFRAVWAELKITLKRFTTKGWVRDF